MLFPRRKNVERKGKVLEFFESFYIAISISDFSPQENDFKWNFNFYGLENGLTKRFHPYITCSSVLTTYVGIVQNCN